MPPCPANFCIFRKGGFHHVGQAGLKLLASSDPPASASQSAGFIGMSHLAQLKAYYLTVLSVRNLMWVSLDWNQDIIRDVFLSGSSRRESFPCLFLFLGVVYMHWLLVFFLCLQSQQHCTSPAIVVQLRLLLTTGRKGGPCVYTEPT